MPRWLLTIPRLALLLAASPLLFLTPAKAQNTPLPKPATAPSAQVYGRSAAMAATFTIDTSRIAAEKASSPAVSGFAERLVKEHQRIAALVVQEGTPRDEKQETMLTQLRAASPSQFDRVFLTMQLKALEDTVQLHESYRQAGTDPEYKKLAAEVAPMLQQQLADAAKIAANLGTETRARFPTLATALP
jgi:putative membrane protein